jgi:hypothetical protein
LIVEPGRTSNAVFAPGFRPRRENGNRVRLEHGKKVARFLKKIRRVRGLSEDEKHLFARSLAATPDERWRMHGDLLRSHDLYTRSARKKYGFK